MNHFFILSLPRCRTLWLSLFLTTDKSFCYHDSINLIKNLDEYLELFKIDGKEYVGDSSSANILMSKFLLKTFPFAKMFIINRNVEDVVKSLTDAGHIVTAQELSLLNLCAKELKELSKIFPSAEFTEINKDVIKEMWEYFFPTISFDKNRYELFNKAFIQLKDVEDRNIEKYLSQFHVDIETLKLFQGGI